MCCLVESVFVLNLNNMKANYFSLSHMHITFDYISFTLISIVARLSISKQGWVFHHIFTSSEHRQDVMGMLYFTCLE